MRTLAARYEFALRGLEKLSAALLVMLLVILVAVIFGAVVMRYVFNAPLIFSFDLSTLLFAWLVFLGLYIADREDGLMGLDLVPFAPPALQRALTGLRILLCLALCLWLAWLGWKLFQRSGAQIASLRIASKWLYLSLPVGFGLLALSYSGRLLRLLTGGAR